MPDWTDEDFLGYVSLHSETERALFHREHALRLIRLSGSALPKHQLPEWLSIHARVAKPLVNQARCRLVAKRGPYGYLLSP